jgi:hypothetical protein
LGPGAASGTHALHGHFPYDAPHLNYRLYCQTKFLLGQGGLGGVIAVFYYYLNCSVCFRRKKYWSSKVQSDVFSPGTHAPHGYSLPDALHPCHFQPSPFSKDWDQPSLSLIIPGTGIAPMSSIFHVASLDRIEMDIVEFLPQHIFILDKLRVAAFFP